MREATRTEPKLDQVAAGVLILLLIVSPIAFGAVHPLSYRPMEAVLFGLAIIWMVKTAQVARSANQFEPTSTVFVTGRLALPLVAFTGFALLQLVPLPPPVIRALSPQTYDLYRNVLEDWPYASPYQHIGPVSGDNRRQGTDQGSVILPTKEEVNRGDPIPFVPGTAAARGKSKDGVDKSGSSVSKTVVAIYRTRWRPIAIAPVLTWSSLLMLLACACAFLVTAYYPFNDRESSRTEFRFLRRMLRVVLAMGFVVAFIGLIDQATWNGKLLWFFIPYDWGHPLMDATRTRAPFVDPDHFAGYLGMIFPLALASTLYPSIVTAGRPSLTMRIVCAVASFVIFVAMLLSLSRAGWMSIVLGPAIMFMLVAAPNRRSEDEQLSLPARRGGLRLALGTLAIGLALTLVVVGPDARTTTTERFNDSLTETDAFSGRITAWQGGAKIVRDFPIVGIGLGDWPEIFARYQSPPWTELFFSEAHNDYIQWTAETGLIGAVFLLWFAWAAIRELTSRRSSVTALAVPVFAAIVAGLVSMCVIELFDFDLRIPALAFLFAVMLGLGIRLTSAFGGGRDAIRVQPSAARVIAICASVVAIILIFGAFAQNGIIYPRNLVMPHSADDARGLLLAYPANAMSHISLVKFEGDALSPARRNAELERALWLEPLDPQIRDEYVRTLILAGRNNDALKQIRLSVLNSPGLHWYLAPRMVAWLTPPVQRAIEDGLREAIRREYSHAPEILGDHYALLGRFRDEAEMYNEVAEERSDPDERAEYLVRSGQAYAREDDTASALVEFRAAAEAAPDNSLIYSDMAKMVFAPRHDLSGAEKAVNKGIADGADPQILLVALAEVALAAGDTGRAEAAFEQALEYAPDSYQTLIELAQIYARDGKVDRAVLTYQKAIDIEPDTPDAYFQLAEVQESNYRYYAAEQAYRKAAELAPNSAQYQQGLADFRRKLKAAAAASPGAATP
jgi:O-antigen ligase/tetratricopeptide (TPR) repeat protein